MKKIIKILVIIGMFVCNIIPVKASNIVNIYFFHGDGCGFCHEEKEWLETVKQKYPNIVVHEYEVWYNEENKALMEQVKEMFNVTSKGVPFTVIGENYQLGFNETIAGALEEKIRTYSVHRYEDKVGVFLGRIEDTTQGEDLETKEETDKKEEQIKQEETKQTWRNKVWVPLTIVGGIGLTSVFVLGILSFQRKKKGVTNHEDVSRDRT